MSDLNNCRFVIESIQFGYDELLLYMTILGAVSAVVEWGFHFLEDRFEDHLIYLSFLRRMYKELMILGLLSFIMILIRDFSKDLTKNGFQLIEFAHLWIFCVGFAFVVQGSQIAIGLRWSKVGWDRTMSEGLESIAIRYERCRRSGLSRCRALPQMNRMKQQLHLYIFRSFFLATNNLPRSFEMAKYWRRNLSKSILEDLDIGWQSWLFLCISFLIGFIIAKGLSPPPRYLDADNAVFVVFTFTWFIVFVCSFVLLRLFFATRRVLKLAGFEGNPDDVEALLQFALEAFEVDESQVEEFLSDEESNNGSTEAKEKKFVSLPYHLNKDQIRLDKILIECKEKQNLNYLDFLATSQHKVFDVLEIKHYRLTRVVPKRAHFVVFFRLVMLCQSYVFGLTLLLMLNYKALSTGAIVCVAMEWFGHLTLFLFFFPRIARDYSVISAVAEVDERQINLIEDAFFYQQDANESIFLVSSLLHKAYLEFVVDHEKRYESEQVERCVVDVFKLLNEDVNGKVPERKLQTRLNEPPFHHHVKTNKLRHLFRALNCLDGITLSGVRFLIHGMLRMDLAEETRFKAYQSCFPLVTCMRCEAKVPGDGLEAHVKTCANLSNVLKRSKSALVPGRPKYGLLRPFVIQEDEQNEDSVRSKIFDEPIQVGDELDNCDATSTAETTVTIAVVNET